MTIDGQYLTYAEYVTLGGSKIGETPFNLLEFEARRRIDDKTSNRLKDIDSKDIPQEVKLCVNALVNSIIAYKETSTNMTGKGNIKSENIDGYSVSYISANEISNIINSKIEEFEDIIRTYLIGVIFNGEHLMYVGV